MQAGKIKVLAEQHATRADRARYSDGKRGRLSGAVVRKHRRHLGPARHVGGDARGHRRRCPRRRRRPAIAKRLADIGTIMDIRGPAESGKAVEEQRDRLADIAKVLGLKAAQ